MEVSDCKIEEVDDRPLPNFFFKSQSIQISIISAQHITTTPMFAYYCLVRLHRGTPEDDPPSQVYSSMPSLRWCHQGSKVAIHFNERVIMLYQREKRLEFVLIGVPEQGVTSQSVVLGTYDIDLTPFLEGKTALAATLKLRENECARAGVLNVHVLLKPNALPVPMLGFRFPAWIQWPDFTNPEYHSDSGQSVFQRFISQPENWSPYILAPEYRTFRLLLVDALQLPADWRAPKFRVILGRTVAISPFVFSRRSPESPRDPHETVHFSLPYHQETSCKLQIWDSLRYKDVLLMSQTIDLQSLNTRRVHERQILAHYESPPNEGTFGTCGYYFMFLRLSVDPPPQEEAIKRGSEAGKAYEEDVTLQEMMGLDTSSSEDSFSNPANENSLTGGLTTFTLSESSNATWLDVLPEDSASCLAESDTYLPCLWEVGLYHSCILPSRLWKRSCKTLRIHLYGLQDAEIAGRLWNTFQQAPYALHITVGSQCLYLPYSGLDPHGALHFGRGLLCSIPYVGKQYVIFELVDSSKPRVLKRGVFNLLHYMEMHGNVCDCSRELFPCQDDQLPSARLFLRIEKRARRTPRMRLLDESGDT